MINVLPKELAQEHKILHPLLDFLGKEYPLPRPIRIVYDYTKTSLRYKGTSITGHVIVDELVSIDIAAKDRSPRAVALTTAHEYMHCIQFIVRDLYMDKSNKDALEEEAILFAEDVLRRLWTEQKIFYPSSM